MSKILFIVPYPADQAPSQRFRFEQYLGILEENGFTYDEIPFLDEKGWKSLYVDGSTLKKAFAMLRSFGRRFGLMFRLKKYDHIFIHREASMIGPPIFEWIIAKALRRKFIYDFDDAIWLPNYSDANAKFHRLKMYKKVNKIMKWASTISAGNNYLAEYARQFNSNIRVIPTTVDTVNLHNQDGDPDQSPLVIGWTGTHTTAKYIASLLPLFDRIQNEHPFMFRVISNHKPDFERDYLDYVKWKKESEIEDLCTFNIGIMPLEENIWSKGKCGFKGLQYMALKIPAVMSPVGVNVEIINDGVNGHLCLTEADWERRIKELLIDHQKRARLGAAGRKTVEERYSVLSQTSAFLNLFEK